MPIRVKCGCGKTLAVKEALAGKTVKCPACQKPLRIPAAGASATQSQPQSRPPARSGGGGAAAPPGGGELDHLFEEEGFAQRVGKTCPACAAEMKPQAVICTACGFNTQTGTRLAAHRTAAQTTVHGHQTLDKAAADMASDQALQKQLQGTGLPWWVLVFLLVLVMGGAAVGVLAVDYALAEEGQASGAFNPLDAFLLLVAAAFWMLAIGAGVMLLVRAFQESVLQGVLVWFVPFYVLYYVATRWSRTWRPFALNVLAGLLAGICIGLRQVL